MKRILLLLLLSLPAVAQNFYSFPPDYKFPNGQFFVCGVPASGNPCSNQVSIFPTSALTGPISQPAVIGPDGNYGFWLPSAQGQITIQLQSPYGANYVVSLGGGGGGSGTVSANNTAAGAVANYAAAGGSTTVGPTTLNYVAPTVTVSTAGGGNGAIALSGNTSGTATLTAPAVAGTSTNPVVMSNTLQGPVGSVTAPTFQVGTFSDGISSAGQGAVLFSTNNSKGMLLQLAQLRIALGSVFGWTNTANDASQALDTAASRDAAGVLDIGNGTAANTSGRVKAAGYMSVGTTFTSNAGCGDTTLTGGATAGKYTSVTAGTCTTIITMGNSATAPNGWSCTATDLTTAADAGNIHQTATTTTTASLNEGTVAASDVIQFSCIGY